MREEDLSGRRLRKVVANVIEEGRLGGPQIRIANVARAIKPEWETVVIFPREDSRALRDLLCERGIQYEELRIHKLTRSAFKLAIYAVTFFAEIYRIARTIKTRDVDLVHVSGGAWQIKGLIAARLVSVPAIWHMNDTHMPAIVRRGSAHLSKLTSAIIFASERSRSYYGPLVSADVPQTVIPAPVDTRYFNPTNAESIDLSKYFKCDVKGKTVIVHVGNINMNKGQHVAIEVAEQLNRSRDDFVVVLVGQVYASHRGYYGRLMEKLGEIRERNIVHVSDVYDVRPWLASSDIMLCTSKWESSPTAVWEGMSMGLAVISTNVGDVPVHIGDGYNGFLVENRGSGMLVKRLEQLLESRQLRRRFGVRAREVAVDRLDIGVIAGQYKGFYGAVCQQQLGDE